MAEEKETKVNKEKAWFWIRFASWVLFSLVMPILFINYRYQLFSKVSKVSLSGWCLFIGVIVFVFSIILVRYVLHSAKYSYLKQVIKGAVFLILPLLFVIYCLYCCRDTIDQLIQVLSFCCLSWVIAIAINPMPQWVYNQSKGEQEDFINYVLDKRVEKKSNK